MGDELKGKMSELRAIQTHFDGYHFRSRLEARWAYFLNAMGIKYYYEREGYDLDGECYLPDFEIPLIDIDEVNQTWRESERCVYLEIKPTQPSKEEIGKAAKLAKLSFRPVAIIHGEPYEDNYEITMFKKTRRKDYALLYEENVAAIPFFGEKMKRSFWAMLGLYGLATGERDGLLGNVGRCYVEAREAKFDERTF
jgi:hypothetical protein